MIHTVWIIHTDKTRFRKAPSLASCQPSTYLQNLISLVVQLWWAIVPVFWSILTNYRLVCFWSLPPRIRFVIFCHHLVTNTDWTGSKGSMIRPRTGYLCVGVRFGARKWPEMATTIILKKVSVQPLQWHCSYGMIHTFWYKTLGWANVGLIVSKGESSVWPRGSKWPRFDLSWKCLRWFTF